MRRRHFMLALPAAAAGLCTSACSPENASAPGRPGDPKQGAPESLTIGMLLEPPGLDPTAGAAAAIAEITLYNVYETLTKIGPDGRPAPLLALNWENEPDLKHWTFYLRRDAVFSNGQPLTAQTVKYAFERAAHEGSTNKDKRVFANMRQIEAVDAPAASTADAPPLVRITLAEPEPDLPFLLGQATSIIVEPQSAAHNASQPTGTGPYALERWNRGALLTLQARPDWRDAPAIAYKRVHFRFIGDPAAQIAALLAGDVDLFPRVSERGAARLQADKRFVLKQVGSRAKTILAFNHRHPALADVRVRRAICAAIDRQAVLQAAQNGMGQPIGSHYTPGAPGYVDTTGINPHDPDRARDLLRQAALPAPLALTLTLPPTPYARQGGEVIMAQLAQVGIQVKAHNVEWAQWLDQTYGQARFDLTLISHVEPFDLGNWAKPGYYWGYHNPRFNQLYEHLRSTADETGRDALLAQIQRLLAEDAAAAFLYQPRWLIAARQGIQGLPDEMPLFTNDLSALRERPA